MARSDDGYLFSETDLDTVLKNHLERMRGEIDAITANDLLKETTDSWADHFESRYRLRAPEIDETARYGGVAEVQIDVSRDRNRVFRDRDGPVYVTGTAVSLHIPYSGDSTFFKANPFGLGLNAPKGVVKGGVLQLTVTRTDHDNVAVQRELDDELAKIKRNLEQVSKSITRFNSLLRPEVTQRVERRRQKVLKDRDLLASLEIPIHRRTDAPSTYSAPVTRRRLPIKSGAGASHTERFAPEPALELAEYEHILSVCSSMAHVMERSPQAFREMREEDLRMHFLVQLNGQYEGSATGETFNYGGKTDILIRHDGRNVFIAECKFWTGAKAFGETIDQILGYASWRDTKVAILVFNRNKDLTAVVAAARGALAEHAHYLRSYPFASDSGFRAAIRHKGDDAKELLMTVLFFDIPT